MSIPRDSARLLLAQGVGIGSALLSSIVISRVLGPADRGIYYLVLGVAMLAVSIGGLGFGSASCHALLRRGGDVAAVHANALVAAAAVGLAVLGCYALAGPALHRGVLRGVPPAFVWTGLLLVPAFVYTSFWSAIMGALGRFDLVGRYEVAAAGGGAALTALALLVFRFGAGELLAVTAASTAILAAARARALHGLAPPWKAFDPALFLTSLAFGLRAHPGHLALYACLRADVLIVNLLAGTAGVGHYTLASSIAERVWRLPGTMSEAAVARIGGQERGAAGRLAARVLRHSLLLAGGLALALAAAAPWGLPLVYGRAFSPAVAPLLILLPGSVCTALVVVLSSYLTYQLGRPHVLSVLGMGAAAVYLPLAWWATARLGLAGAALASTAVFAALTGALLVSAVREPGLRAADALRFTREDVRAYAALARSLTREGTRP